MNTCDLEGADLDTAVARALGWIDYPEDSVEHGDTWHMQPEKAPFGAIRRKSDWQPSINPNQGMNIIEEFGIATRKHSNGTWYAMMQQNAGDCVQVHWNEHCYRRTPANPECKRIRQRWQGRTMLEAAMRCLVGWHLGEVVEL